MQNPLSSTEPVSPLSWDSRGFMMAMREDLGTEAYPISPELVLHCPNNLDDMRSPLCKRRRRQRQHEFGPRKRVTFAEDALLYPGDRTAQDIANSWYSKDELNVFKDERRDFVRLVKKSNFRLELFETPFHCIRGYEPYFSIEVNRAIKKARALLFTVVFAEQSRQRAEQIYDDESLRECSLKASDWARSTALQLGANDAAEAYIMPIDERDYLVHMLDMQMARHKYLLRQASMRSTTSTVSTATTTSTNSTSSYSLASEDDNYMTYQEEGPDEEMRRRYDRIMEQLESAIRCVAILHDSDDQYCDY